MSVPVPQINDDEPDFLPRCHVCDYDLRGLTLPQACPECGNLADPGTLRDLALHRFSRLFRAFYMRPPANVARRAVDLASFRGVCRRIARDVGGPWLLLLALMLGGSAVVGVRTWERSPYPDRAEPDRITSGYRLFGGERPGPNPGYNSRLVDLSFVLVSPRLRPASSGEPQP